jgi:hypothetical protein
MPRTARKRTSNSRDDSSSDDSEDDFDETKHNGKWSPIQSDLDNSDDSDNDNNEVSLEAIKKKTLGRKVKSIYDVDSPAANIKNDDNDHSKMIMDVTSFTDGKTAANHLRQDLTCPICHDRLYNPASLLCGHSFCQTCLVWWLNELGIQTDDNDSEDEDEEANTGTCPTCRHALPPRQKGMPLFRVNTALKACLDTLYGVEMNQRRMAEVERKHRAIKGEGGGLHQRGNEEIVKLTEEGEADVRNRNEMNDEANGWVYLHSAESGYGNSAKKISIRRNVVMDDCDQRYQLSMGMTKCVYLRTATSRVVDVELCLIAMEEDEVESGGFPAIIIEGSDDEALICVGNDRVHTCIQSSAILMPALKLEKAAFGAASNEHEKLKEVTLSRGMIGRDGNVRFRIDVKKILDSNKEEPNQRMELAKLKFSHLDTSVVLELRLPEDDIKGGTSECNIDFGVSESNAKNDASRFLLDDKDEEEEEMPNEYEDDGFVVNDSNDESDDEVESDNDECGICHNGGDLLICDGGDHGGGCGKSYHVECVNRNTVPEGACMYIVACLVFAAFSPSLIICCLTFDAGEWICKACASALGIKTGVEGHEWEADEVEGKEEDQSPSEDKGNGNALVDSDDEEEVTVKRKKRRKVLDLDSDSDDE